MQIRCLRSASLFDTLSSHNFEACPTFSCLPVVVPCSLTLLRRLLVCLCEHDWATACKPPVCSRVHPMQMYNRCSEGHVQHLRCTVCIERVLLCVQGSWQVVDMSRHIFSQLLLRKRKGLACLTDNSCSLWIVFKFPPVRIQWQTMKSLNFREMAIISFRYVLVQIGHILISWSCLPFFSHCSLLSWLNNLDLMCT